MELTPELIQKHIRRLVEATTNVRAQTRHSKKGKIFNVKAHERKITPGERAALNQAWEMDSDGSMSDFNDKSSAKSLVKKGMIKFSGGVVFVTPKGKSVLRKSGHKFIDIA